MTWYERLDRQIADYLPDMVYEREVPLAKYTSFRIGGAARRMAFPAGGEQLVLLQSFAEECGGRPFVMGNGTNLLFPDGGVDRLVIHTREMNRLTAGEEQGSIVAECGVSLSRLAMFACGQGLTGLEFAHGIPGSVGGGVCMNAGAYGGELAQVIDWVELLLPEEGIRRLSAAEMAFSYRHSLLTEKPEAIVLRACFHLTADDSGAVRSRMEELMARRKASQPLEYPSAGSTFKRPAGHYAAALIDRCGLKGLTAGGAQVSEKHAGFVINRGGATCDDVMALIGEIQRRVKEATGVTLEPEVKIIY